MEKKLLRRIEGLRKRLNKFGPKRNLIDSEVIRISQELDSLLNQYQKIIANQQLSLW